ncbi:hypothetical protein [Pigmentiphaga kullae]|uniref:hypothetical protein n=1 Tax=Pigmentiphaga kullae TaxID=151784 RepID=UPI001F5EA7EB|nr:hypothetical protein [Pigmentiphaga kullae]
MTACVIDRSMCEKMACEASCSVLSRSKNQTGSPFPTAAGRRVTRTRLNGRRTCRRGADATEGTPVTAAAISLT